MESQQCLYPSIGIVWHSLIGVHTLAHIQKHAHSRFVCSPSPGFNRMLSSFPVDSSPQQLQIHVCCHANPPLTFDFQFLLEAP